MATTAGVRREFTTASRRSLFSPASSAQKVIVTTIRIVLGIGFYRGRSMRRNSKMPLKEVGRDPTDYRTGSNAPHEGTRSLERALGAKIRAIRRERDLSVLDL